MCVFEDRLLYGCSCWDSGVTRTSYCCKETLGKKPVHKHITGMTCLPFSAPVFNHYICTHTLLPSDRNVQRRGRKKRKERKLGRTIQSLHVAIYPLTGKTKGGATESGNLCVATQSKYIYNVFLISIVACGKLYATAHYGFTMAKGL